MQTILDPMAARRQATTASAREEAPAAATSSSGRRLPGLRRSIDRRPWLLLLALLPLLLATPALANLAGLNASGDESGYLRLADNLSHGSYLVGRPDQIGSGGHYPDLWFGPGLPIVLVPFVALGVPLAATRLLGPLFVFLAAVVLFSVLRLHVSERAAVAGGLALGLYVPLYTVLQHLHSETLAVLLVALAMYGTSRYLEQGRARQLAVAAVPLGWLALTRVAYGWVLIVLLVLSGGWWLVGRSRTARRSAAICAMALVVTVPWLAYTYSVTGKPLYWGASGGLSLYWAASPYPGELGDWHRTREVFADPRLGHHRPFFDRLRGRPLADQDEELVRAGLDNIRSHPGKYASNVLANISRMWFDFPYSFQQQRLRPLAFIVPNAFLLVGLVVAAALLAAHRRPRLPVAATAFAAFAATAFVVHALLAAYPRMLFPLVPVLIWFVVLVLCRLPTQAPVRR
jgi:Dolichyl-phosphate-mannose-protein mannosyltransferase